MVRRCCIEISPTNESDGDSGREKAQVAPISRMHAVLLGTVGTSGAKHRPRTEAPELGRAAVHACCNTQLKQSDFPVVWLTVAAQPGCLTPTQSKNVFPISTKGPPKAHLHVQQVAEV